MSTLDARAPLKRQLESQGVLLALDGYNPLKCDPTPDITLFPWSFDMACTQIHAQLYMHLHTLHTKSVPHSECLCVYCTQHIIAKLKQVQILSTERKVH